MKNVCIKLVVFIVAFMRSGCANADTPGSIPAELTDAATAILKIMNDLGQTQLQIGPFVPVGDSQANGGPGIRLELLEALQRARKGVINKDSKLAVQGKFAIVDDPDDKKTVGKRLIVEKLTLEVIGIRPLDFEKTITIYIRRLRDIAILEGVTLSLDQNNPNVRSQNAQLREVVDNRKKHLPQIEGSKVRSGKGSPYALEFLVMNGPSDTPRPLEARLDDEGFPNVSISKQQLYELNFYNDSKSEVGISIKIDGIDVFAFADPAERDTGTGKPRYSHFIIPAREKTTIQGWFQHVDRARDDNVRRFLVTEYGQGAASKFPTNAQGTVGVVTVEVSNAVKEDPAVQRRGGAETGFGPPAKVNFKPVQRSIDPPHDFISVRYLR
jgi:hypothetical protein